MILYEAALSFLGVGVTDQPSWGQMISDATPIFSDAWWYMLFPGLALLFTVLAFNLVGDAMQDALNPRAKRRLTCNELVSTRSTIRKDRRCEPSSDGCWRRVPSSPWR